METILFLLLLGLGIALLMGLRNTQHAAERSRSLAAHLDVELQATWTALLARIDVLEKQVAELQTGGVAAAPPEPTQPESEEAPAAEPSVAAPPQEELPTAKPTTAAPPPVEPPPIQPAVPSAPPVLPSEPPPLAQLSRRIDWEE